MSIFRVHHPSFLISRCLRGNGQTMPLHFDFSQFEFLNLYPAWNPPDLTSNRHKLIPRISFGARKQRQEVVVPFLNVVSFSFLVDYAIDRFCPLSLSYEE